MINVKSVSLKFFSFYRPSTILYWEYVTTFLMRNLTRLFFYINNDSKARMKYLYTYYTLCCLFMNISVQA